MLLSLALMALLVLAALSAALLSIGGAEVQIAANHLRSTQAHYLAEAGLEDAFDALRAEPGRLASAPAIAAAVPGLAGPGPALAPFGSYTVTYQAAGPRTVRVIATGMTASGGAQRTLRATITSQFASDVAVLTEGDLAIRSDLRVLGRCGSVHANGRLGIAGSRAEMQGRATAAGGAEGTYRSPSGRSRAVGGQPRLATPRVDAARLLRAAQDDPVASGALFVLTGDGRVLRWNAAARTFELLEDQTTEPSARAILRGRRPGWEWRAAPGRPPRWRLEEDARPAGTFYVEGHVEVTAGAGARAGTWNATLVAAGGSIRVDGAPRLSAHLPGVALAAEGDVAIAGHGAAGSADYEGLVLAREGIDVGGSPTIRGGLVAARADISGDATIAYDCDAAPALEGPLRILAWGS